MVKNYISHHGILGQKWGIRRYQNADGSLTAAGRARYGYTVSKPTKDLSKLNDNKKLKIAKKQYSKDFRNMRMQWNQDSLMEDFARLRESDDLKKWGSNKEFKSDMKKAYQKYVDYEKKGGYGPDYQDKLLAPLYKKYPGAKNILDGMSFWEADSDTVEGNFSNHEYTIADPQELLYGNWIRNLWNNDYYYDTNQNDIDKAYIVANAAKAEMVKEYTKMYGKEIVDKLLK